MATVAESLFGVTPESLQQERQNALLNRGIQLAQLDPFQQAYANIYAGAGNVGRGVGGLLGAEDPELMRVRQRQQLLQGINPADPASLRAAAQRAMEFKDFQAAQMLSDRATTVESDQAKLASERALASQRLRPPAGAVDERARGELTNFSVAVQQLKPGEKLSVEQDARLRALVGQLTKPRPVYDQATGTVTTFPAMDLEVAAPAIVAYLGGKPAVQGEAGVTPVATTAEQPTTGAPGARTFETPKSKQLAKVEQEALSTSIDNIGSALVNVDKALSLAGPWSTGWGSKLLGGMPNTEATAVQDLVKSIDANKIFTELQALKAASKTGASGLGAVTEKELDLLAARIRVLNPQSKTFIEDLKFIKQTWEKVQKDLKTKQSTAGSGGGYSQAQEAMISRWMSANKRSREEVISYLKSQGKL